MSMYTDGYNYYRSNGSDARAGQNVSRRGSTLYQLFEKVVRASSEESRGFSDSGMTLNLTFRHLGSSYHLLNMEYFLESPLGTHAEIKRRSQRKEVANACS